jgi:hypothetical protein
VVSLLSLAAWAGCHSLLDASCLIKGLEPCCAADVAMFAVWCCLRLDGGIFHMPPGRSQKFRASASTLILDLITRAQIPIRHVHHDNSVRNREEDYLSIYKSL